MSSSSPSSSFIYDYDDNDEYLQAQLNAFAELEKERERHRLQDLESQAVANAIALSEQEIIDQHRATGSSSNSTQLENENIIDDGSFAVAAAFHNSAREYQADQISSMMESHVLQQKQERTEERNHGCWDCQSCTYTNRPYTRRCQMCRSRAPSDVLTFSSFPSSLRFGVEIEIIVPDGKRDGYDLNRLAQQLTKMGPPKVHFAGYSHHTTDHWKIVTDASLKVHNADNDLSFEMVSPILQGEPGLASLRAVLDNVRRIGITTNSTCGFHVHVDATRSSDPRQLMPQMGTLQGIKRVVQLFVAFENAFDLIVARSWQGRLSNRRSDQNRYCRSNRLAFGSMSNRQRWEKLDAVTNYTQLVSLVNPHRDRYRKLNLTNITNPQRPSTCEFRHHGGVKELLQAEAWVRLVVRFCQQACKETANRYILPEESTPEHELEALFRLIDCDGLAQFFVTEKRLFGPPSSKQLRNEWECHTCHRQFGNSRALAQHTSMTGHS